MEMNRRNFMKAASAALLQLQFGRGTFAATDDTMASATLAATADSDLGKLLASFAAPPDHVKPGGYWWWFNNLVNKAGITRDMEEFKSKGIGEVLLVNSAANEKTPMPSGPDIFSDEWYGFLTHALAEAQRLGIKIGINLCAGWCMGGPWIKPEESGRWYLQSQKEVTGPSRFSDKLPLPDNTAGYVNVTNPPGIKDYFDLPLEKLDYRDTAVTAIRLPASGNARIKGDRLKELAAKANREDASNWTRADIIMDKPTREWTAQPDDAPISVDSVIDLTGKMQADGHLDWDVPEGNWVIVRTGHRMTGSSVFLGLPGADGLSIDWLNRRGVEKQFASMGQQILDRCKPYVGNTLIYFCDDSFEDGFPNWTENIVEQFKKYRGYDPVPWLPTLCGYIVGSAELSDRFLHDYRKTVADLMADEHYGRFAELCHTHGLQVQNEAAGPSRSGTMCMDGLKNLGRSDYPMGEFWLGKVFDTPEEEDPSLGYGFTRLEDGQNKVTKMAASAAHIYGKTLVSTESFTATGRVHWGNAPRALKYAADRAFCEGVNRIMIHTTTCTRPEDGKPGYEYYAGTHFNPNVTWWNQAGPFLTYIARCQQLLREGLFVADVLYYNGDWAPNLVPVKHIHPGLGKGYDYDVCNEEVLLTRLAVKDGRIVMPDGMSYRILVLPDTDKMPLPVLQKLKQLSDAGAAIAGKAPKSDPGLKDYPHRDANIRELADQMWGAGSRIYGTLTPREVLADLGVAADFAINDDSAFIDFIHRKSGINDVYFLLNRLHRPETLKATFRVNADRPAFLLDAVTGQALPLKAEKTSPAGTCTIKLEFEPRGSYFVVFGEKESALRGQVAELKPFRAPAFLMAIDGPWDVKFDTTWGGPESANFPALLDWSQHEDERIRYYSGSATYQKTFQMPTDWKPAKGERLWLDLGTVRDIADVQLNGKNLGTMWCEPWRADITDAIKPGDNTLELNVTNCWPNRLIGDARLPKEKRLTNTNIEFQGNEPLLPSGLLGPVQLMKES